MLLNKKGFPEEGELVLCKVTKVSYNSVFANLEEYGKHGMIHISEVSPGRIRNLNDYVKLGKMVVCKILRVNQEKGHIDLSLRRVNEIKKGIKITKLSLSKKQRKLFKMLQKNLKLMLESSMKRFQKFLLMNLDLFILHLKQ